MTRVKNNRLSQRLTVNRIQNTEPSKHAHPEPSRTFPEKEKEARSETPNSIRNDFDEKTFEEEFNKEYMERIAEDKKHHLMTKIVNIFLVLGCVYIIFLIYGVSVTDYQYNQDGQIEAQKLSVSDIKAQKDYEHILSAYLSSRALYEKTLMLDYRLGAGEEEPMVIAPEYEALLTEVEDLSIKTDALKVNAKYEQIKSMLLTWIQDDIAVYLQNMSASISENNEETANNALQDKDRVYSNFSLITQNMVATGEETPGIDLTDLKSWTPEEYVNNTITGE